MKLNKRILALNIGLIALVIFSITYIMLTGSHYTMRTNKFSGHFSPSTYSVEVADESVIKCSQLHQQGSEIVLELDAVGKGSTTIKLRTSYTNNEYSYDTYELEVNNFNIIIEKTRGRISFSGLDVTILMILFALLMIEVVMLWMFIDYFRKGNFSYAMIACGGLSIYIGFLLIYTAYRMINNVIYTFTDFLFFVSDAGIIMLFMITPLMFTLSALLAVSNIWLMRHEGYRPVNTLGIIFAVLWFIGTMLTSGAYFLPFIKSLPFYDSFILPLNYIICYVECMFLSTVVCSFLATKYKMPYDRDYIIILGCAIRKDGTPTPLLKGRVDKAVEFAKKQLEKTGKKAVFVPSGGQGSNEVISEGESMENYLLSLGIPKDQIAREDKSVNTFENMKLSKKVIENHADDFENKKIAFSTTNYHVFRGYILAKKNGFEAKGLSAKTKLYFFPNAFLREFAGLLVDKKWKHLVFILIIICFFLLLNLII